ncbi:hypothetical protein [Cyanobium sp. CH-040]|uniref:hypothetical protein n=1 Tax=Cyanobium sp. CH-040 TaxID=2823708 RepID=UPI0020CDCB22|nr:hypothetical protein [Cyanobium sp. CH-040]
MILLIAGLWALAALGLPGSRRALTTNSLAWITFAVWEALVQAVTPEANIRVDLLLITPLLSGLGLWGLVAILWRKRR